jgi:hypothetical protein
VLVLGVVRQAERRVRVDGLALEARAELERHTAAHGLHGPLLEHECAEVARPGRRHERLLAGGDEVDVAQLHAGRAAPRTERVVDRDAGFPRLLLELRADRAVAFQLRVFVIAVRAAHAQLAEPAIAAVERAREVVAVLHEFDPRARAFFLVALRERAHGRGVRPPGRRGFFLVLLVVVRASRQPVVRLVARVPDADEPARADERGAERGALRVAGGVVDPAARAEVFAFLGEFRPLGGRGRVARDPDVVGLARERVHVQCDAPADAEVQSPGRGALAERRVAAQLDRTFDTLGQLRVDAVRHDVHQSADRAVAVQQRRRTLQDLDLVGGDALDADRVVGRQRGHVERLDAVLEHLHALAAEAADHRAAGVRAEVRAGHAELARDRLADADAQVPAELVAGQHDRGLRDLERAAFEGRGGDYDLAETAAVVAGRRGGEGGKGNGGEYGRDRAREQLRSLRHEYGFRKAATRPRVRASIPASREPESGTKAQAAGGARLR